MKKLPKIYQTEILKKITNNKKKCYVKVLKDNVEEHSTSDITLDEIFSGLGYSYNIPIIITTKSKIYNTSLIAKTNRNLITIDNELIPISEVISIKKKKS